MITIIPLIKENTYLTNVKSLYKSKKWCYTNYSSTTQGKLTIIEKL